MVDIQSTTAQIGEGKKEPECGPMLKVMAALSNIGGTNKERKFPNSLPCPTLKSLADAHCSGAMQ